MAVRLSSLGKKQESGSQMMKRRVMMSVAACGLMAATAANYTLTNTTVEWPSSNEAENVSGNRFTIVGDVTVVITNVTVANVSLGALRANMVVTDGATLTVDFTDVEAARIRIWGTLVAHGTGKIRVKGDTARIAYGLDGTGVQPLPQAVFDAPDFAFVDASGDALDVPLTFSGPSGVRRWPSCGRAFSTANICLIGDEGVRLAPDEGTDAITLSSAGLRNLVLVDDAALAPSTKVNVPTDCGLYMKPASFSTNKLSWAARTWGTNSTDVVLAGGKLSLQSMPDHVLAGDITGTGTVAMEILNTHTGRSDEYSWLLGENSFEGSVIVAGGSGSSRAYDSLNFGASSVPGHATNKVTLAAWSQLAFFAPDGTFAPNVTIGSLAGTDETSVLYAQEGQTVTINAFTGMFRLAGGGTVVFGPEVGPVASCRFGDGFVYTTGDIPAEFSISPYVNDATGTNTLTLGGTPLFTGASTSFVVQASAGARARVLADGNVPVIAGGEGTAVIETRDWRDRAALWIDSSTTEPGPFGTCAKDEWWAGIGTSISNRYVNEAQATGGGYYIEYMPDCRPDRTYYFGRNGRNYQRLAGNPPSAEYLPTVYAYQKFNGCNGLTTICCAGGSRRLPLACGDVKGDSTTSIPAKMVVMVFGSQDGGGKGLVGTSDGAFARTAGVANGLTTSASANIWLDGVKVASPNTQTLNGGWQVVSVDTTGHNVNGFGWAKDYSDAGGQNYGEILVFTNALSDVERTLVESYLAKKWGISTYAGGTATPTVRAVGRTGTIEVPSDTQVTLGGCYAGTVDVKAGATLTISDPLPPTADELPTTGHVGWFDPDAEGALYQPISSGARAEEVSAVAFKGQTADALVDGAYFLWAAGSRRPFRALGARGWGPERAWLDFQELDVSSMTTDTGNCLRPRTYPSTTPLTDNSSANITIPCRTAFIVSDSFRGGGSPVLGGVSGGSGIAVRPAGDYQSPIWASGTHARITGGETRLNGVRVASPTVAGFTGAPEVFSFTTTADQNIGCFGYLYNTQKGVNYGEVLGEILLYNQVLTGADRLAVEAYLMGKWCGTLPEGYSDLREATVTGAGTVVASAEKMPRLDAAFAGTAKVTGESAVFDVTIDSEAGTVTGAIIAPNATLELPANATINVTFTSKPIHGGSWTLVDIGTAAPQDLAWTVNASVAGMSVVKSITPAHVAIEALPSGTTILLR